MINAIGEWVSSNLHLYPQGVHGKLRKGFTIIEALISFGITILLVTLVFQFSAQFYSGLVERSKLNTVFLENYSAFDHIVRNLSQACGKKENWLKVSGSNIVWRESYDTGTSKKGADKLDRGYELSEKGLCFIMGSYSVSGDFWKKGRKNLLSSSIKEINFVPNISQETGNISCIVCKIVFEVKDKSYKLVRVIGLKNGIYV